MPDIRISQGNSLVIGNSGCYQVEVIDNQWLGAKKYIKLWQTLSEKNERVKYQNSKYF